MSAFPASPPLISYHSRPLLFRATSAIPLQSWSGAYVPHPHANILSADSFSRGVVRSATDFSVYALAGLEGLDFAFYRGRSRYHTKYDSIPGMTGGKKALWAMMENTHGASIALANRDNFHVHPSGQRDRPVYFDRKHHLSICVDEWFMPWCSIWQRPCIILA